MPRYFQSLADEEKQTIWEALNSGSYYLFVGSGVSLDSNGPKERMRSTSRLTEDLRKITELGSTSNLQQNYRLLTDQQIQDHLTSPYTCQAPGKTISLLAETRWRRIYTLNIDNCFEIYVRNACKRLSLPENILSVFNFNELYSDPSPLDVHSIIHLHGLVERPESGYVFSHTEYAREMSRQNSWMATLTQLMKAEPFIIAGTSLEEIDVEYYLQQHSGISSDATDGPCSILIEPFPTKLTERACKDHNLVLYKGTVEEFYQEILENRPPIESAFHGYSPEEPLFPSLSPQKQILFESSFEIVPKSIEPAKDARRFLFGAPLTWGALEAKPDINREAIAQVDRDIERLLRSDTLAQIYLAEPGDGKSAILKRSAFRAAKKFRHVFYFTGFERISEDDVAEIFNQITSDTIVFFDNAADFISYFVGVWDLLTKRNIAFIGTERVYRFPYLDDALSEFDAEIIQVDLGLSRNEAARLIDKNEEYGFSDVSQKRDVARPKAIATIVNEPISVANCRIQNNFITFDALVRELIKDTPEDELKLFTLASLSRYCFSGGVSKAVLHAIPGRASFSGVDDVYTRLPVVMAPNAPGFVIPARAVVSERVLEVLKTIRPEFLLKCLVELSIQLAPRVNRKTISARTPDSKLAGGLMDFDRTVQRFIDNQAESFYEQIEDAWEWNSRYWEQKALLKLSRYLEDQSDPFLLQESIQNARYAYSIDEHPLSLTTLAKTLFAALDSDQGEKNEIFSEAWRLIFQAIEIEKGWTRVKPTAFIVAFKGAVSFAAKGGQFSGSQADELREALAITHQRKFNDRKLNELRDLVREFVRR